MPSEWLEASLMCLGIKGLAQAQGVDMSTPHLLAETDARMLAMFNMALYFQYILKTATGSGSGDRIETK